MVCPGVEASSALATAQQLCDSIAQPFIVEQHSFELSVGIGLALYPQHAAMPLELLKHADIAMHQAKRQKLPVGVF